MTLKCLFELLSGHHVLSSDEYVYCKNVLEMKMYLKLFLLFNSKFGAPGGIVDPVSDGLEPVEPAGPARAVPLPLPPLLAGQAPGPGIEHNLTAELVW